MSALRCWTRCPLASYLLLLLWPRMTPVKCPNNGQDTKYLNGVRGIAPYWYTYIITNNGAHRAFDGATLERSFGFKDQYHFSTLPWIGTLFSGAQFVVAVFCVTSVYVLSVETIRLLRAGEHVRFLEHLSSSLCRRRIRLYGPVVCTTAFYIIIWHAFSIQIFGHEPRPTVIAEFRNWFNRIMEFSYVFPQDTGTSEYSPPFVYNTYLWTVPLEFRSSVVCYCLMLATYKSSTR